MHPLLQWQLAAQRRGGLLAEAQRRRLVRSITDHPESEARSFSVRPTPAAVVHGLDRRPARGDPQGPPRRAGTLGTSLSPRESEVLALMAEGRSNAAIADLLVVGRGAVEKHVANIFLKLGLEMAEGDNRRVLAVLRYLES